MKKRGKKVSHILSVLLILFGVLTPWANLEVYSADTIETWVDLDQGITYDLNKTKKTAKVVTRTRNGGTITIPAEIHNPFGDEDVYKVTELSAKAFLNNGLTGVTFEEGCAITSFPNNVFEGNQLESITIPSTVKTIGNYALKGNLLRTISLPSSVTSIGIGAFRDNLLEGFDFPSWMKTIPNECFMGNSFSSLDLSSTNITSIGNQAFESQRAEDRVTRTLTSINLGNKVTTIGTRAFFENEISDTNGPNFMPAVTSLGTLAFHDNKISKVEIPNTLSTIPNAIKIGDIMCGPFTKNSINELTFQENSKLTTIGTYAFDGNTISNIVFPDSLIKIADYSLRRRTAGACNVTFGTGITTIEQYAFSNFSKDSKFFGKATTETTLITNTAWSVADKATLEIDNGNQYFVYQNKWVYSPNEDFDFGFRVVNNTLEAVVKKYKGTDVEPTIPTTLMRGTEEIPVTTIGEGAFSGNKTITKLVFPPNIQCLEANAFQNCTNLEELQLNDGLLEIKGGSNPQNNGTKLTEIHIPSTVTMYSPAAFFKKGCTSKETAFDVYFAKENEELLLNQCYKREGNQTDRAIYHISDEYFETQRRERHPTPLGPRISYLTNESGSEILTSGRYYWGMESGVLVYWINDDGNAVVDAQIAKAPNNRLEIPFEVELEGTTYLVKEIGNSACSRILWAVGIGSMDFSDYEIIIAEGIEKIGDNAFYYQTPRGVLELPDSIKEIGYNAFSNIVQWDRSSFTLKLPANLEKMGNTAFDNIKNTGTYNPKDTPTGVLGELTIPETLKEIPNGAFQNNNITNLTLHDGITTIGEKAFLNNEIKTLILPKDISLGKDAFAKNPLERVEGISNWTQFNAFNGARGAHAIYLVEDDQLEETKENVVLNNDAFVGNAGYILTSMNARNAGQYGSDVPEPNEEGQRVLRVTLGQQPTLNVAKLAEKAYVSGANGRFTTTVNMEAAWYLCDDETRENPTPLGKSKSVYKLPSITEEMDGKYLYAVPVFEGFDDDNQKVTTQLSPLELIRIQLVEKQSDEPDVTKAVMNNDGSIQLFYNGGQPTKNVQGSHLDYKTQEDVSLGSCTIGEDGEYSVRIPSSIVQSEGLEVGDILHLYQTAPSTDEVTYSVSDKTEVQIVPVQSIHFTYFDLTENKAFEGLPTEEFPVELNRGIYGESDALSPSEIEGYHFVRSEKDGVAYNGEFEYTYSDVTQKVVYYYIANNYTVHYNLQGGSGVTGLEDYSDKTNVKWEDDNLLAPTPKRLGYDFKGWNTMPDNSGRPATVDSKYKDLATTLEDTEITLYAIWEQVVENVSKDKTVTRTIHYKMNDGSKAPDGLEQKVIFKCNGKHYLGTGDYEWEDWTPESATLGEVVSPEIANYEADKAKVDALEVGPEDESLEVTVTYTKVKDPTDPKDPVKTPQPVFIQFEDEDGKTIASTIKVEGKLGDEKTVQAKAIEGYQLVIGRPSSYSFTITDEEQVYTFVYTKTPVPDVPKPETPVPALAPQPITIHYVDDKGNTLHSSLVIHGEIGDKKKVTAPSIEWYTLVTKGATQSFTVSDKKQSFTFVYKREQLKDTMGDEDEAADEEETPKVSTESSNKTSRNTLPSTVEISSGSTSNNLPTTGETQEMWFLAIGGLLASVGAVIYINCKREKA